MAAPLTERELLIARHMFNATMEVVLQMVRCGFDPQRFCVLALEDPEKERRIREKLERELDEFDRELEASRAKV